MARFEDKTPLASDFSLPPSLKSKSPLAVLAQLRLQTAKASKGHSLSVQTSSLAMPDGRKWEGVVPSGLPHDFDDHDQNSFRIQDFSCEDAGNLRQQVGKLASLHDASSHSPARPKTACLTYKTISMDVLDPNEWERVGRQIQSATRPASAQPRKCGESSASHSNSKVEDWRPLLRQKAEDIKNPDSSQDTHSAPQGKIIYSFTSRGNELRASVMRTPETAPPQEAPPQEAPPPPRPAAPAHPASPGPLVTYPRPPPRPASACK